MTNSNRMKVNLIGVKQKSSRCPEMRGLTKHTSQRCDGVLRMRTGNMLLDNPETVVQSDMPIAAGDQGPSLSQTVKHVDEFSF